MNKSDHQPQFPFRQRPAKGRHSVAAVGELPVDLVLALKLKFAFAKARNYFAVLQRFTFAFRPVAYGAMLSEKRRFVRFAHGNDKPFWLRIETGRKGYKRKHQDNKELSTEH